MRISLILAHPSGASLCAALASAARDALSGHEVRFHHLDAEGFDPRLGEAELAGRNWWSQPPALLKGWLDRVVRPGVAYEFRRDRCRGVFPRCGIPTSHREVFAVVASSTVEQRAQWLARAAELMRLHFPVLTGGPANAAA